MGRPALHIQPFDSDVICLGCGYNLRALDVAGRCPECNEPIARSIHGDLLRYADKRWRTGLARGVSLVYYGLLTAVGGLFLFVLTMLFSATLNLAAAWVLGIVAAIFGITILIGAPGMIVVGWWLAGTRDPAEDDSRAVERSILRVSGMAVLPVFVVWMSLRTMPLRAELVEALALLCLVIVTAHLLVLGRFMQRVHQRCAQSNEHKARKRLRVLKRLRRYAVVVPALVLALHIAIAIFSATAARGAMGYPGFGWGAGVGFVLTFLLWISITSHLAATLREIRAEAAAASADGFQLPRSTDPASAEADGSSAAPHSEQAVGLPDFDRS